MILRHGDEEDLAMLYSDYIAETRHRDRIAISYM